MSCWSMSASLRLLTPLASQCHSLVNATAFNGGFGANPPARALGVLPEPPPGQSCGRGADGMGPSLASPDPRNASVHSPATPQHGERTAEVKAKLQTNAQSWMHK